jgi:hypothetical protein
MYFESCVQHLGKRGFVTRKKWNGTVFVFFGMDNVFLEVGKTAIRINEHEVLEGHNEPSYYNMNLDDIKANDWETVDLYWNGSKDNGLPFQEKVNE